MDHFYIKKNVIFVSIIRDGLKFARLHGEAVLRPAVRVHSKLIVFCAVDERAHVGFLVGWLWAKCGQVVLVGIFHDLEVL